MAAPWEKYQQAGDAATTVGAVSTGGRPWEKYAQAAPVQASAPPPRAVASTPINGAVEDAQHPIGAGELFSDMAKSVIGGIVHGAGTLADVTTGTSPGPGSHAERWAAPFAVTDRLGQLDPDQAALHQAASRGLDATIGTGPLAQTIRERVPQAVEAISTVIPIVRGIGNVATSAVATRAAAASIPTREQLGTAASAAYKRATDAGVVVTPQAVEGLKAAAAQALQGLDSTLHPATTAALKRVVATEGPQTLDQLENLRRVAKDAVDATANNPADRRRALQLVDHIDDFMENLRPEDVTAGNAPEGIQALQDARNLYSRNRKTQAVDDLMDRAQTRASGTTGSGLENAIRVEFRQLAMNQRRMRVFTPEEQAAIKRVARGGTIDNGLRWLGKWAPTGVVSTAAGLAEGGLALPVIGTAMRAAATRATESNVDKLSQILRRGPPGSAPLVRPDSFAGRPQSARVANVMAGGLGLAPEYSPELNVLETRGAPGALPPEQMRFAATLAGDLGLVPEASGRGITFEPSPNASRVGELQAETPPPIHGDVAFTPSRPLGEQLAGDLQLATPARTAGLRFTPSVPTPRAAGMSERVPGTTLFPELRAIRSSGQETGPALELAHEPPPPPTPRALPHPGEVPIALSNDAAQEQQLAEALGLTPDVLRAAAEHPGAPRMATPPAPRALPAPTRGPVVVDQSGRAAASADQLAKYRRDLGVNELGPGVRQPAATENPERVAAAQSAQERVAAAKGIALTGKELTPTPGENIVGLKQKARNYAHTNFADKTVTNQSDGSQILITKAGIDHAFSGKVSRKAALATAQLDRILERGELVSTEADKDGRPDIRAVYHYDTPITIAGKPAVIRSVVREHVDGRRYYDHFEVKPDGSSGSREISGTGPAAGAPVAVRTSSEARPTGIDLGAEQSTSPKPTVASRATSQVLAQRSEPFSGHTVAHTVDETGQHILRSRNGEATAQESGQYLQLERIDVDAAARGKGQAIAMMERLLQEARSRGLTLASDRTVSPDQRKVYRALANRGWQIKQNPATINPTTKNLVSEDPRVPVYEVRPPGKAK